MMFKSSKAAEPKTKPVKPIIVGRERLHHFDSELAKAKSAVDDLERRVATLENIGIDAIAADRELQDFIASDGGVDALRAHSSGETSQDDQISKLLAAAKSTSEAAAPAKAALPSAIDALERARSEVIRLGEEKYREIELFMTSLADETAKAYKGAFNECCRLHDELTGFANGTSVYMGDVAMVVEELKVPRFKLPSLACLDDYDPFLRRRGNSFTVSESTKVWTAVKDRLQTDVDSDLSDLVSA
jgi:hypothetical protein